MLGILLNSRLNAVPLAQVMAVASVGGHAFYDWTTADRVTQIVECRGNPLRPSY